ncbi:MAG: DNA polymerase/3'-5' exonuclease PolX, partial [Bacteroidetes bacterium]|nr:DNA polymerase/3'-5' exonuclease PolX [Bacteroidota bacterium]
MDNIDVASTLGYFAKLAELHEQNPFKIKAYAAAAFNLRKVKQPLQDMTLAEVEAIPGVGKSVSKAIVTLANTGSFPELEELERETPAGVLDMLHIKGLGPKKVHTIWKSMGLLSVEALQDACRENRLVAQSGFGYKTQSEIIKAIEFAEAGKGSLHYARAEPFGYRILEELQKITESKSSTTGAFRRAMEVLQSLDFISTASAGQIMKALEVSECTDIEDSGTSVIAKSLCGLPVHVLRVDEGSFYHQLLLSTGPEEHTTALGQISASSCSDEQSMYQSRGLHFIPAEVRDHPKALEEAVKGDFSDLISFEQLQGVLHNHSTWSDGLNTLEEMALACKSKGYAYFAICDHSRSAAYAHGLETERVLQQFIEVEAL